MPCSGVREIRKRSGLTPRLRHLTVLPVLLLVACGQPGASTDARALLEAADKDRDAHRTDECINGYTKVLAAQSQVVKAYVGRAACYIEKGNAPAAVLDYNEAVRLSPNDPSLYLLRGAAHETVGNRSAAAADYKRMSDLPSANPDQILQGAQSLGNIGYYPDALAVVSQGLRAFPSYSRLHQYRANLEVVLGDDQEALKEFEAALRSATGTGLAAVLADRGNFYAQRQKYSLAVADLDQAIRVHPDYTYFEARAQIRLASGDFGRAAADLTTAITIFKTLASADKGPLVRLLEKRGKLYLEQGQRDKALVDFRQALEMLPPSAKGDRARVTAEITSAGG